MASSVIASATATRTHRRRTSITRPPSTDTAAQEAQIATICPAVMPGKTTDAVSTTDSVIRTAITPEVNTLVMRRFTHGPSTSLSLQSSSRKSVALGSSTPARTWTPSVISPSGEPGISTIVAAPPTSAP